MKVAVIGCGVGGMAAAARLARDGHQVELIERFEEPAPIGAGLLIQPSGLAGLDRLALGEEARALGAEIKRLIGRTPAGSTVLDLRYGDGRPGDQGLGLHRGALFELLYRAVRESGADILTGHEILRIEDWARPVLYGAAGERFGPYDLVVIADGAHSDLRAQVCPEAKAPLYPWGAVWSIRPDSDGRWHADGDLAQVYRACSVMIGVLPVGRDPLHPDGPRAVSLFWSLKPDQIEAWRAAGPKAFRQQMARHWPEAAELLDGLETLDGFASAVYRDIRAPSWRRGAVVLLGDAAHGMSPQLGQGANLALNDAHALADSLREDRPVALALPAYEKQRRPVVRFYTWMSWALTPVFQSNFDWIGALRDAFMGGLCRLPGIKQLMIWTLVGRGRTPW